MPEYEAARHEQAREPRENEDEQRDGGFKQCTLPNLRRRSIG